MYLETLLNNHTLCVLGDAAQQAGPLCTWRRCSTSRHSVYLDMLLNNHALCVHGCAVQQPRCLTDYKGISRRMQELNTHTHYVQVLLGRCSSTTTHARYRIYLRDRTEHVPTHTVRIYMESIARKPHALGTAKDISMYLDLDC